MLFIERGSFARGSANAPRGFLRGAARSRDGPGVHDRLAHPEARRRGVGRRAICVLRRARRLARKRHAAGRAHLPRRSEGRVVGLLDRAIAVAEQLAPEWAMRRARARVATQFLNSGYSQHGASRTKKALAGWVTVPGGPD